MLARISAAALAATLVIGVAFAQGGLVKVDGAWARATPPRAEVGAVYLTLTASTPDRLVGVSTPAAAKAEVHEMSMENGVMRMRETSSLALPAGQPVVLGPGGYHIMLTGLKGPLKPGQTIPLHLTFASAPPADVTVNVRGTGGQ
ncbi:MAG: copper chaperone PCu(A)C [Acetobacteraceae bacterium]|nr:copper chaperone PCu(A)C [Acetobacteraceae bacterium]